MDYDKNVVFELDKWSYQKDDLQHESILGLAGWE